jgi:hypothetical protein
MLLLAQLSRALRDHARSIPGKSQLFINAFAKALEVSQGEADMAVCQFVGPLPHSTSKGQRAAGVAAAGRSAVSRIAWSSAPAFVCGLAPPYRFFCAEPS